MLKIKLVLASLNLSNEFTRKVHKDLPCSTHYVVPHQQWLQIMIYVANGCVFSKIGYMLYKTIQTFRFSHLNYKSKEYCEMRWNKMKKLAALVY